MPATTKKPATKKPTSTKKGKPGKPVKWVDSMIFTIYDLHRDGATQDEITSTLGISLKTWQQWKQKPLVQEALKRSRPSTKNTNPTTLKDYIYSRLSKDLKTKWDTLVELDNTDDVESHMQQWGTPTRQHLFLFAFLHCGYNPSDACAMVNIGKKEMDKWIKDDPEFCDLFNEMHYHKKNFLEGRLINLIQNGDTAATLFANRTLNRDRGYNEKVEIDVSGQINHTHAHIDVTELDLPLEVRTQILEALQKKESESQNIQPLKLIEEIPESN